MRFADKWKTKDINLFKLHLANGYFHHYHQHYLLHHHLHRHKSLSVNQNVNIATEWSKILRTNID